LIVLKQRVDCGKGVIGLRREPKFRKREVKYRYTKRKTERR